MSTFYQRNHTKLQFSCYIGIFLAVSNKFKPSTPLTNGLNEMIEFEKFLKMVEQQGFKVNIFWFIEGKKRIWVMMALSPTASKGFWWSRTIFSWEVPFTWIYARQHCSWIRLLARISNHWVTFRWSQSKQ